MEEVKDNSGQNLGVAALITAIITFVLAVIPCVGFIAIIPGIITIVLASVGLSHAVRNNSPRGLPLAGLIIGVVAIMISFSNIFIVSKFADGAKNWPNKIENIVNDVQENVTKGLEDANISIKVENGGQKVEINTTVNSTDRQKVLEDLEKGNASKNDTLDQKKGNASKNDTLARKK